MFLSKKEPSGLWRPGCAATKLLHCKGPRFGQPSTAAILNFSVLLSLNLGCKWSSVGKRSILLRRGDPWSSRLHTHGLRHRRPQHAIGFGQLRTAHPGTVWALWDTEGQSPWDQDPGQYQQKGSTALRESRGLPRGQHQNRAGAWLSSRSPEPAPETLMLTLWPEHLDRNCWCSGSKLDL